MPSTVASWPTMDDDDASSVASSTSYDPFDGENRSIADSASTAPTDIGNMADFDDEPEPLWPVLHSAPDSEWMQLTEEQRQNWAEMDNLLSIDDQIDFLLSSGDPATVPDHLDFSGPEMRDLRHTVWKTLQYRIGNEGITNGYAQTCHLEEQLRLAADQYSIDVPVPKDPKAKGADAWKSAIFDFDWKFRGRPDSIYSRLNEASKSGKMSRTTYDDISRETATLKARLTEAFEPMDNEMTERLTIAQKVVPILKKNLAYAFRMTEQERRKHDEEERRTAATMTTVESRLTDAQSAKTTEVATGAKDSLADSFAQAKQELRSRRMSNEV